MARSMWRTPRRRNTSILCFIYRDVMPKVKKNQQEPSVRTRSRRALLIVCLSVAVRTTWVIFFQQYMMKYGLCQWNTHLGWITTLLRIVMILTRQTEDLFTRTSYRIFFCVFYVFSYYVFGSAVLLALSPLRNVQWSALSFISRFSLWVFNILCYSAPLMHLQGLWEYGDEKPREHFRSSPSR